MNKESLLLIAILVLIALIVVIPGFETFDSSVNCALFPDSPACKPLPSPQPIPTNLNTCQPENNEWTKFVDGRVTLNSPCCDPNTGYQLAKTATVFGQEVPYKTCDDKLDPDNPLEQCVATCCENANHEANNYDPSWYPLARCACSLWCYNQDNPHFKKYGTAVHYITGDLAEANTDDSGDFIGGTGYDFSGK